MAMSGGVNSGTVYSMRGGGGRGYYPSRGGGRGGRGKVHPYLDCIDQCGDVMLVQDLWAQELREASFIWYHFTWWPPAMGWEGCNLGEGGCCLLYHGGRGICPLAWVSGPLEPQK
jgi:hypothetical protein